MFPDINNFVGVNWFDIIQVIASVLSIVASTFLGIAALIISKRSIEREEEMRNYERNLAVSEKVLEVYNYFVYDINGKCELNNENLKRLIQIRGLARIVFDDETNNKLQVQFSKLQEAFHNKKFPEFDVSTIQDQYLLEQLAHTDMLVDKNLMTAAERKMNDNRIVFLNQIIKNVLPILEGYRFKIPPIKKKTKKRFFNFRKENNSGLSY